MIVPNFGNAALNNDPSFLNTVSILVGYYRKGQDCTI